MVKQYMLIFFSVFIISACVNGSNKKNDAGGQGLYKPDFIFNKISKKDAEKYLTAINFFYDTNLIASGFNGAILVAKNGQILFEDYHGYSNFVTKETITPHTPFHLASISKT